MKKFLSVVVMLLAFAAIANAQGKLGFTVEAGLNLSKFGGDTDDLVDEGSCDMKSGFNLGVMADMPFTDAISLKAGLKYTQRGWKNEFSGKDSDGDYYEEDIKVKLGYLQIPIMATYHFVISDNIELLASVGPYFAFALHGKEEYDDDDRKIKFGEKSTDYKRFDFGLVLPSVGVKFQNFYVGISNEFGLVNVYTPEGSYEDGIEYDNIRNYCFSINVGYTF